MQGIVEYLAEVLELEEIESRLLQCPKVEIPVRHHFAPGVYLREAVMPAGALIMGHAHKQDDLNIVLTGSVLAKIDGKVTKIAAPAIFRTAAGVRKIAYVLEETRWLNVHANPADETNLDRLESALVTHSETFRRHQLEASAQVDALHEKEAVA